MENKVNFIPAINYIDILFFIRGKTKETKRLKRNPEKMGLRFFPINFHG